MTIKRFEDLECWQEARRLTKMAFVLAVELPFRRGYRLADQMTGAALSAMNNIAEGFDSQSNMEFVRFLGYARRSASEVQACLYAALDSALISQEQFDGVYRQAATVRQVIDGFLRYLRPHVVHQRAQRAKQAQRAQPAQRVSHAH